MKIAVRALVFVGLICACLLAIHSYFLVRADFEQADRPAIQIAPTTQRSVETITKPTAVPEPIAAIQPAVGPADPCSPRGRDIGLKCEQAKPEVRKGIIGMLPGQTTNVSNRQFRKILIQSEFPIRVVSGNCHSNYTVQFFCEGDPSDIFITDMRNRPVFRSPQSNPVSVTLTEY